MRTPPAHPRMGNDAGALTGAELARPDRAGIRSDPPRCRRLAFRVGALGPAFARGPLVAAGVDRGGPARFGRRGSASVRRAFHHSTHGRKRGAWRGHRAGWTDLQPVRTLAGGGAALDHWLR